MIKKILILVVLLSFVLTPASILAENDFPSKPLTFIVPWGSGGSSDVFSRTVSNILEEEYGINTRVVNVPGAQTRMGTIEFMQSNPDGHTIFQATSDMMINLIDGSLPYKAEEFKPLMRGHVDTLMLFKSTDEDRFDNFNEMVEYSKENPLYVAITGVLDEIPINRLNRETGADLRPVPYDSPGERYSAVVGGHTDLLWEKPGATRSWWEGDNPDYEGVIVLNEERLEDFPETPTTVENDIDLTTGYWRGFFTHQNIPEDHEEKLLDLLRKALSHEIYEEYLERRLLNLRQPAVLDQKEWKEYFYNELEFFEGLYNEIN